jgi:hypothetical protein
MESGKRSVYSSVEVYNFLNFWQIKKQYRCLQNKWFIRSGRFTLFAVPHSGSMFVPVSSRTGTLQKVKNVC